MPELPAIDEVMMMLPLPAASIARPAYLEQK
jgi:hypothetical protein